MKCKDCKEVMCKHRSTNAEMDCVLQVDVLKEHRFPKSKVWHDSNTEQPERGSSVVVVKGRSGDVIDRVVEVYPNRIWAYLDDLLGLENSMIKTIDQETVSEELEHVSGMYGANAIPLGRYYDKNGFPVGIGSELQDAFIAGAKWQKTMMIAKACEWMDKEAMKYIVTRHGFTGLDASMTEDFRKHLEDE